MNKYNEPLAKLMSSDWLPHSGPFPSWNFCPWIHHAHHSTPKMVSKWDCHSSPQSFASGSNETENIKVVGVGLAKNTFHLHGVNEQGKVMMRKKLNRRKVAEFMAKLQPCLIGAVSEEEIKLCAFPGRSSVVPVTMPVSEKAVELYRQYRMRLPGAIIRASSVCESSLLVSRNTQDFPADHPGVREPSRL